MQRAHWALVRVLVLGLSVAALALALGCSGSERPGAAAARSAPRVAAPGLRASHGALPSLVAATNEVAVEPVTERLDRAAEKTREEANAFVALQRRLATFSAEEDLGGPTYDMQVPAAARPLLKALKRAGRDVIEARLAELLAARSRGQQLPAELATAALEPFERAGAVLGDQEERQAIGSLDVISLRELPGGDQLFAATLGFGLPCGYDEALFVFRNDGAGLEHEHVLTAASDDYASIADGQLALEYAVSPRDAQGGFYVVTAHATPWCSSAWRQLTYRAYAPSGEPERPTVLVSGESDVWIGDGLAQLEAQRDRFELRFLAWDRLGPNVTVEHRVAFERERERAGGKFASAAPRFRDPDVVPNAWVSLEWTRAEALVVPESRRKLRALHARWREGAKVERGAVSVRTAGSAKAVVRFACDDCTTLPARADFVLERREGVWRIRDVK